MFDQRLSNKRLLSPIEDMFIMGQLAHVQVAHGKHILFLKDGSPPELFPSPALHSVSQVVDIRHT